jgi:hypothetical protein
MELAPYAARLSAVKRSSIVMAVLAAAVVAVAAYILLQRGPSLPTDPLAMVPADAYGLVRIKASRVVKSDAWKRLVIARDEARGIERVEAECGFNPFAEIDDLVVFARPSPKGGMPRFAFAARGPLKHEAIIDCLRKISGKGNGALKTEDVEGVTTVRSDKGTSRAAFIGRDGVIGGDSESVHALINTLKGKAQSAAADPMFRDLFADVQQGTDIAFVARMPEELVPMLRMVSRLGGGALSDIAELRAVAASASLVDDRIAGGAVLVTPDAGRAQSLVELVAVVRARLLDIPGIAFTPANAVLNSIKMEARNDRATFTGAIKVSAAEALLEYVPALTQLTTDDADKAGAAAARFFGDDKAPGTAPEAAPSGTGAAPAAGTSPQARPATPPAPGTPTVEHLTPATPEKPQKSPRRIK